MKKNLILFGIACSIGIISCQKANLAELQSQPEMGINRGSELGASNDDAVSSSKPDVLSSNFNGTPIDGGDYIWFNLHAKINSGASTASGPFNLQLVSSTIKFEAAGVTYNIPFPNAKVIFTNGNNPGNVAYSNDGFHINLPSSELDNDEIFMSGVGFKVPANGFPGGIKPVDITTVFRSNATTPVSVSYQWSAAVYTDFSTNYNQANITPIHNSLHAGAPMGWKRYVTGGARGGGGSNYTGSWSGTHTVVLQYD